MPFWNCFRTLWKASDKSCTYSPHVFCLHVCSSWSFCCRHWRRPPPPPRRILTTLLISASAFWCLTLRRRNISSPSLLINCIYLKPDDYSSALFDVSQTITPPHLVFLRYSAQPHLQIVNSWVSSVGFFDVPTIQTEICSQNWFSLAMFDATRPGPRHCLIRGLAARSHTEHGRSMCTYLHYAVQETCTQRTWFQLTRCNAHILFDATMTCAQLVIPCAICGLPDRLRSTW